MIFNSTKTKSVLCVAFVLFICCVSCNQKAAQNTLLLENSGIKTFRGNGIVTKINLKLGSVELDHEEIKGAMPAMIMEFYVLEKSELETLQIGDKVEFVLEENRGQEKLISIKKVK